MEIPSQLQVFGLFCKRTLFHFSRRAFSCRDLKALSNATTDFVENMQFLVSYRLPDLRLKRLKSSKSYRICYITSVSWEMHMASAQRLENHVQCRQSGCFARNRHHPQATITLLSGRKVWTGLSCSKTLPMCAKPVL